MTLNVSKGRRTSLQQQLNIACVQGFTIGTISRPISFKVLPKVPLVTMVMPVIGSHNGTIGKPMVPLATNCTFSKITNGTIGRTPNGAIVFSC